MRLKGTFNRKILENWKRVRLIEKGTFVLLIYWKVWSAVNCPLLRGFHYSGSCLTKMHMGYQFSVEFNAEMKNEDNFDLIFLIYSKKSKNGF